MIFFYMPIRTKGISKDANIEFVELYQRKRLILYDGPSTQKLTTFENRSESGLPDVTRPINDPRSITIYFEDEDLKDAEICKRRMKTLQRVRSLVRDPLSS